MVDLLTHLKTRRSPRIVDLAAPGPSAEELETMLAAAVRSPDHGKLAPWRFIVFEGTAREAASEAIGAIFAADNPGADAEKLAIERTRLVRAPLAVAVVSKAAPHPKIPEYEQLLSGAAVAMNLCHAAFALGYGANWVTEWMTYDRRCLDLIGLAAHEKLIGFVHIGTIARPLEERPRPALADVVTRWGA